MFLQLPFGTGANLVQTVLVLNTVILITALIIIEFTHSDTPRFERRNLRIFIPVFVVMAGIFALAAIKQAGA